MIELLRAWHWAGGAVPGGLVWLLLAIPAWIALLILVIRPIGVFRNGGLGRWLAGGVVLLVGIHGILRQQVTPPEPGPRLALWPAGPPAAQAAFGRVEQALRAAGRLVQRDGDIELMVIDGLLGPGALAPRDAAQVAALQRALGVSRLVLLGGDAARPEIQLWSLRWEVGMLDDREPCASAGRADLEAALGRLLGRHLRGIQPPPADWDDSWLPLHGPVVDSAACRAALPTGPLPLWEDLRRADLARALGAPATRVAADLERLLARADSLHGAAGGGAEPWLLAGWWFSSQGDWEQVGQALANALAVEPGHPAIYLQLAHLSKARLGAFRFRDQAAARERALELFPGFLPALFEQVVDWQRHHQGAKSLAALERALVLYPEHGELWLVRGNVAYETLDYLGAKRAYEQAARLLPGDARPWLNLGQLCVMHREWALALPALDQALARGAAPLAWHLKGLARVQLGDTARARGDFLKRLSLGGDENELAPTWRQLARLDSLAAR